MKVSTISLLAAVVLLALTVTTVHAVVMTGDHFTIIFTDTSPNIIEFLDSNPSTTMLVPDPNVGSTATADITLGTPASAGFFNIATFTAISGAVNLTSGLLTENLSAVSFDATTLDLKGDVTGTFTGGGGGLHHFDLALTDPAATWTFTNDHVDGGFTEISSGTYRTVVSSVPEPSTWLLLGSGLAGLMLWRQRTA